MKRLKMAYPKPEPHARTKARRRRADRLALARFRQAVWKRDRGYCRYCKEPCVNRAYGVRGEVHHIVGRRLKALRTDVRNGVLLCADHHEAVTRHRLRIIPTSCCLIGGAWFGNANEPLCFEEEP